MDEVDGEDLMKGRMLFMLVDRLRQRGVSSYHIRLGTKGLGKEAMHRC